jgi:hypothetical protein
MPGITSRGDSTHTRRILLALALATCADSPYKTFADVVAAARAKKNLAFGTVGSGSLGHLAMALLSREGGLEMTHVPYKGGGPGLHRPPGRHLGQGGQGRQHQGGMSALTRDGRERLFRVAWSRERPSRRRRVRG